MDERFNESLNAELLDRNEITGCQHLVEDIGVYCDHS